MDLTHSFVPYNAPRTDAKSKYHQLIKPEKLILNTDVFQNVIELAFKKEKSSSLLWKEVLKKIMSDEMSK